MLEFKATIFEPEKNNELSAYFQCIEKKLPIFSYDMYAGSGAKDFLCCGWDYFITTFYKNQKEKVFYEVIPNDKPVKLYIDIDYSYDETYPTKESIEPLFQSLLETVGEVCYNKVSYRPKRYHVMESSSETKFSRHVIWEIFFENNEHCGWLVDYLLEQNPQFKVFVDDGVYTKFRSFRLLYSTKKGKNRPITLLGKDTEYNEMDLFNTLITCYIPSKSCNTKFLTDKYNTDLFMIYKYPNSSVNKRTITGKFKHASGHKEGIIEFFKTVDGHVHSSKMDHDESKMFFIVGNLRCPWIGNKHISNNTYVTLDLNSGYCYSICSDPECPKMSYNVVDLSSLLID